MEGRAKTTKEEEIIDIVADWDGDLTAIKGLDLVFTPFYTSLHKDNIPYNAGGVMLPVDEIMDKIKAELSKQVDNKRNPKRITEGGYEFLKYALNNPRVRLTVCTKNRENYIKALLQFEGFTTEEINKINIKVRSGPEQRANLIVALAKNPGARVRFHDDDSDPIALMTDPDAYFKALRETNPFARIEMTPDERKDVDALSKKFTSKAVTLGSEFSTPDERVVLVFHDLEKDSTGKRWVEEIEVLEKILNPEVKEEQKPIETKDQKQEVPEKSKVEREIEAQLEELEKEKLREAEKQLQADKQKLALKKSQLEAKKRQLKERREAK